MDLETISITVDGQDEAEKLAVKLVAASVWY